MRVTFINPQGRTNSADLDKNQIIKLINMSQYQVVDFDLPEVEMKPVMPRVTISENRCVACEG